MSDIVNDPDRISVTGRSKPTHQQQYDEDDQDDTDDTDPTVTVAVAVAAEAATEATKQEDNEDNDEYKSERHWSGLLCLRRAKASKSRIALTAGALNFLF